MDLCSDMAEVAIQSFVLNELESIFRRGADWESGFDLILLLKVHCLTPHALNCNQCKNATEDSSQ